MRDSAVALRPRSVRLPPAAEPTGAAALEPATTSPALARDRWVQRQVWLAWGLLFLNVLTWAPHQSILPIPNTVGKLITQGSLPLAIVVALTVNRKVVFRPNVFLFLVSLLAVEALMTALQAQYLVSTWYRTFRLTEFVTVLWLLTPFWGRRDLLLVRCHLRAMSIVLVTVILGLVISPGHALVQGRLGGALWPMPATQVAHYAAVTFGLVVVLWLCGQRSGRATLLFVIPAGAVLLLTHTRTALVAMVAGLLIAGLSLITAKARVRRVFAIGGAVTGVAIVALSGFITSWLVRGQGSSQLTGLSGRTNYWGPLLAFPRDRFQELFGFGLSNDSFNGLPIDSNWFASYQEQGLFGVTICAAILIFLMVLAYFQPRGLHRALALFLVTYCLVASFTEVGFTSASTYLLDLAVAASLLVPMAGRWRPARE
jgi:hypothetical protein